MTTKIKTIKLTAGWGPRDHEAHRWRVEQVTDSTEFTPGDLLDKKQIDELCASKQWRVTIVPYNKG